MIPSILVNAFPPSADALLAKAGELVTDDMLDEISREDYGMNADAHLAALIAIRNEVRLPSPLRWTPKEVLELVRWSQPEDPARKPGGTGERGHIMRAFCCAALLRSSADPVNDGYSGGENQTLIQLIDSALTVRMGLPEAAGGFLTWRIPRLRPDDAESPFFAFGLTAIALSVRTSPFNRADVDALVTFVERSEAAVRDPLGVCTPDMFEGSFLAGTFYDLRHGEWRALAASLRSNAPESERLATLTRRIEAVGPFSGPDPPAV